MENIRGRTSTTNGFPPLHMHETVQNTDQRARRYVQHESCVLNKKRVIVLIVSRSSQQSHVASKVVASEFAAQYDLEWIQSDACISHTPRDDRVQLSPSPDSEYTSEEEDSSCTSDDEYSIDWLFCNKSARPDNNVHTNKKLAEPHYVYSVSLRRVVELALQNITGNNTRYVRMWSKNDTDNPPGHTVPLKQTLRYLLAMRNTIPCMWAKHVLDRMPKQGVFILEGFNTKEEICTFKDAGAKIVLIESNVDSQTEESNSYKYSLYDVLVNEEVDIGVSLKRLVNNGLLV